MSLKTLTWTLLDQTTSLLSNQVQFYLMLGLPHWHSPFRPYLKKQVLSSQSQRCDTMITQKTQGRSFNKWSMEGTSCSSDNCFNLDNRKQDARKHSKIPTREQPRSISQHVRIVSLIVLVSPSYVKELSKSYVNNSRQLPPKVFSRRSTILIEDIP